MHTETFDPGLLSSVDAYKLLIGLVVPRPIGWIGTLDAAGRRNLAPFSFFNVVSSSPPTVLFSAGRRRAGPKDTLANVLATGEFTVNIVNEDVLHAMNETSREAEPDVDEFALAGLTSRRGDAVAAPMVNEAPASMECRVSRVVDIGSGPTNSVVFGEVLRIHVDRELLDGTRVRPELLRAVGRMAGAGYVTTADALLDLPRPT